MGKFRIHTISDTHDQHRQITLPGGDVLIHSGDASLSGRLQDILSFLDWYKDQPYDTKIFVPGNHDWICEENPTLIKDEALKRGIVLLNDSGIILKSMADPTINIRVWGSPIQPTFFNWAFNRDRGDDIKHHWDMIPEDTELLITHGPPYGILDLCPDGSQVGCRDLLEKIYQTKVKLHVFGHIHGSSGVRRLDNRLFVNASSLSEQYCVLRVPFKKFIRYPNGTYFEEE